VLVESRNEARENAKVGRSEGSAAAFVIPSHNSTNLDRSMIVVPNAFGCTLKFITIDIRSTSSFARFQHLSDDAHECFVLESSCNALLVCELLIGLIT